jgi:GT2 family glycosyltransferase
MANFEVMSSEAIQERLKIDFGKDGNGHIYQIEGWSEPEPRYTWSLGAVSKLEFPRPAEPADYMLNLHVHPFTGNGKIASQKLQIVVNNLDIGDFDVRVTSSLECPLPWALISEQPTISLEFRHPNASSRLSIDGQPDERLIAFAFEKIWLSRFSDSPTIDFATEASWNGAPAPSYLNGHVDVFGHNPSANCWLFVGWASRQWTTDEIAEITAEFSDRTETSRAVVGFYDRPGLGDDGVGIVICLPGKARKKRGARAQLISLGAESRYCTLRLDGEGKDGVDPDQMTETLRPILPKFWPNTNFEDLLPQLPSGLADITPEHFVEGHVDLLAFDPAESQWVLLGWVSRPWPESATTPGVARFADHDQEGPVTALFFDRPELRGRGSGYILFMPGYIPHEGGALSISSLGIQAGATHITLQAHEQTPIPLRDLMEAARSFLNVPVARSKFEALRPDLIELLAEPELPRLFEGHVDFYGYHPKAQGWLFCGWMTSAWQVDHTPSVIAQFVEGDIAAYGRATFFERSDIVGRGVGFVMLLAGMEDREHLLSLELDLNGAAASLYTSAERTASQQELIELLKPILVDTALFPDDAGLRALLISESDTADVSAAVEDTLDSERPPSGHVDFYGYLPESEAWLFCGWVSRPWGESDKPAKAVALFENGEAAGESTLATFYFREDVQEQGVGFILSLSSETRNRDHLTALELDFGEYSAVLKTTAAGPSLPQRELIEWLSPLLTDGEANSNRARLRTMLFPTEPEAPGHKAPQGFVDFYGYHSIAGGWLLCGWLSSKVQDAFDTRAFVIQFERGEIRGEAVSTYYPRDDLGDRGIGIVLFVPGSGAPLGGLLSVVVEEEGQSFRIYPGTAVQRLRETELISTLRSIVSSAPPGLRREMLLATLRRQGFTGVDTIGEMNERVFLEFDEIIVCEPNALLLIGWYLAKPGAVRNLRLRCGTLVSAIDMDDCVKIERPDVLTAIGQQHGFDDSRCGFIAFLPNAVDGSNIPYIEIETRRGEVGYRNVPPAKLEGFSAMKRLLECFDVRFLDVPKAYDRVIGPAVELLNKSRLKTRPNVTVVEFGTPPADPEFTVIVPLYGRIDFVEYQFALFSAHPPSKHIEYIYVLDDPPKRREAQFLFASTYERFKIPFRAILFDRNVGFAPANDIGLEYASGKYVCFLNSDAFPGTPDWLERLGATLKANPEIGAVGPLLLYEDGAIQHQGMSFRELGEFGNWYFGHHPGKGLQPGGESGIRKCISITGACMVMERTLADRLRGFDEAYAIGDFEDSDMCLKLHRMGLACAVDLDVYLYHLERKSQAGSGRSWRMNLTLYNAWFHQRRWARAIASHPQAFALGPTTANRANA